MGDANNRGKSQISSVSPHRPLGFIFAPIAVGIITIAVYYPATQCGYIEWDDPGYAAENRHVLEGVSLQGLVWAFTTTEQSNWHPLTWLSMQLDSTIWGEGPDGRHWTNVLLHGLSAGLLCRVVMSAIANAASKQVDQSLVVRSSVLALLWGLHPQHVESVAWISERKDVLSGLFWILTIWVYLAFARRPHWSLMSATALTFAAGLMAKPMLVTLPFVLILLDFWPLGRLASRGDFLRRVLEKSPLFALAIGSVCITMVAQSNAALILDLQERPWSDRLETAATAYGFYLLKTVLPTDLAILYPHVPNRPIWQPIVSMAVVIALSVFAVLRRKSLPYFLTGWFWFLGTLVPVLGLVSVGYQDVADRYVYIPHIGLFWAVVWTVGEWIDRRPSWREASLIFSTIVLGIFAVLSWRQEELWSDSKTLFDHALVSTSDNAPVHGMLGSLYLRQKKPKESLEELDEALRLEPDNWVYHIPHALALRELGRTEECEAELIRLLQTPRITTQNEAFIWDALAGLSLRRADDQEAIERLSRATKLDESSPKYHLRLGGAQLRVRDKAAALKSLNRAYELAPHDVEITLVLTGLWIEDGEAERAKSELTEVLRRLEHKCPTPSDRKSDPAAATFIALCHERLAEANFALGRLETSRTEALEAVRWSQERNPIEEWAQKAWIASAGRDEKNHDPVRALRFAQLASLASKPDTPIRYFDALAVSLAANGKFEEARKIEEDAATILEKNGQIENAKVLRSRAELFRDHRPYREESKP